MKVAIPTDNENGLKSELAEHFGRARNFLIYDTGSGSFENYPNPEVAGGRELPPDFLARLEIDSVISFGLGPAAYEKFKNHEIKMYKAVNKSLLENIEILKKGELPQLTEEDIF